ncbi:MAG TPA: hypothetical protein PLS71_25235 [Leptospiraceae bacterium]|nr:hypothetical protein [Leptospiraceae bacterium]
MFDINKAKKAIEAYKNCTNFVELTAAHQLSIDAYGWGFDEVKDAVLQGNCADLEDYLMKWEECERITKDNIANAVVFFCNNGIFPDEVREQVAWKVKV